MLAQTIDGRSGRSGRVKHVFRQSPEVPIVKYTRVSSGPTRHLLATQTRTQRRGHCHKQQQRRRRLHYIFITCTPYRIRATHTHGGRYIALCKMDLVRYLLTFPPVASSYHLPASGSLSSLAGTQHAFPKHTPLSSDFRHQVISTF